MCDPWLLFKLVFLLFLMILTINILHLLNTHCLSILPQIIIFTPVKNSMYWNKNKVSSTHDFKSHLEFILYSCLSFWDEDKFYHLEYSDYCHHIYCKIQCFSQCILQPSSGVFVAFRNLHRTLNWAFYLIPRVRLNNLPPWIK